MVADEILASAEEAVGDLLIVCAPGGDIETVDRVLAAHLARRAKSLLQVLAQADRALTPEIEERPSLPLHLTERWTYADGRVVARGNKGELVEREAGGSWRPVRLQVTREEAQAYADSIPGKKKLRRGTDI